MMKALSEDHKRNQRYLDFLAAYRNHPMTVADIIRFGEREMRKAKLHHHFYGDYTLKANAECLTAFALGHSINTQASISEPEAEKILSLFERRIAERIPVEYITHEADYLGRKFYVNEHVLVPRSLMNTRFTDFLRDIVWKNYRVLDLCTGSGCIGITLALLEPNIKVDLADVSLEALAVANLNIERYALKERVHCIHSDLFEHIEQQYDLIITNPPYVSIKEYQKTPDEFKNEPKMALEAGKDGLVIIDRILKDAKQYLNPNGIIIAEVGFTAASRIKKKYRGIPFTWFKYRRPSGKISLLGMHGVFMCRYDDLPI